MDGEVFQEIRVTLDLLKDFVSNLRSGDWTLVKADQSTDVHSISHTQSFTQAGKRGSHTKIYLHTGLHTSRASDRQGFTHALRQSFMHTLEPSNITFSSFVASSQKFCH